MRKTDELEGVYDITYMYAVHATHRHHNALMFYYMRYQLYN